MDLSRRYCYEKGDQVFVLSQIRAMEEEKHLFAPVSVQTLLLAQNLQCCVASFPFQCSIHNNKPPMNA
jgi:hypothetical protein